MALYLTKWGHTPETWQRIMANPVDRREVVAHLTEAVGGKLLGLWYAFGDYDGYTLIEAPDDVAAESVMVKVASSGAYTTISTTKLLSVEDALEAFRRAGDLPYQPPGTSA